MKNYIVTWTCNKWASHEMLPDEYRTLYESAFNNCYHLADLFNRINKHLEMLGKAFYPEVISIREV